jgi:hypothetical protein
MDAQRFPLDFQALKRGDYLTPQQVEQATLTPRDHRNYRVEMRQLRDQIMAQFLTRGEVVTVITENDGLRILTHAEQSEHAPTREQRAVRQMLIARAEGAAVDLQQLTDDQRQRHERWEQRSSWRLQQVLKQPPPELMP